MAEKISKYEYVKQSIQKKIADHEWKGNQVIPSENKLCEYYQVSRITIRRAMDELVHEGVLYRIKGKGCFVREKETDCLLYTSMPMRGVLSFGLCTKEELQNMIDEMNQL